MRHAGRVLVVSDDARTRDFLTASLGSAGYDTNTCPGPGAARDCPRLHGIRCTLRESAEVAVVDLDCDEDSPACITFPDDGGTVYVRRSPASPTRRQGLLRAVEDANQHVVDLHAAPFLNDSIQALDLD
jgi:CheY-like chemotaxis protein